MRYGFNNFFLLNFTICKKILIFYSIIITNILIALLVVGASNPELSAVESAHGFLHALSMGFKMNEGISSVNTLSVESATNLRTTAISGYIQNVHYSDSTCTDLRGVINVALDMCLPYQQGIGAMYTIYSVVNGDLVVNAFSDSACTVPAGSFTQSVSSGSSCSVSSDGLSSKFFITSGSAAANPPLPAGSSFTSIK